MGVLNLTPDSFSDPGRFTNPAAAVAHAKQMLDSGADLIDIGGESTRPGSSPIPAEEQIRRVIPVLQQIHRELGPVLISIDTTQSAVASAALDAGASLVNDISAGRDDPVMFPTCAARGAPIVLMHMQGTPRTMQQNPTYENVVQQVLDFLLQRRQAAVAAGIPQRRIFLDPGIGFGKTPAHNLALLRALLLFAAQGSPILVGPSRKSFIQTITGETLASGRPFGTAAAVAWSLTNGVAIVRVHDVGPAAAVARMLRAIAAPS